MRKNGRVSDLVNLNDTLSSEVWWNSSLGTRTLEKATFVLPKLVGQ